MSGISAAAAEAGVGQQLGAGVGVLAATCCARPAGGRAVQRRAACADVLRGLCFAALVMLQTVANSRILTEKLTPPRTPALPLPHLAPSPPGIWWPCRPWQPAGPPCASLLLFHHSFHLLCPLHFLLLAGIVWPLWVLVTHPPPCQHPLQCKLAQSHLISQAQQCGMQYSITAQMNADIILSIHAEYMMHAHAAFLRTPRPLPSCCSCRQPSPASQSS